MSSGWYDDDSYRAFKIVIDDLYHSKREDRLWAELRRAPAATYGINF